MNKTKLVNSVYLHDKFLVFFFIAIESSFEILYFKSKNYFPLFCFCLNAELLMANKKLFYDQRCVVGYMHNGWMYERYMT